MLSPSDYQVFCGREYLVPQGTRTKDIENDKSKYSFRLGSINDARDF